MQSKKSSFTEAVINAAVGYSVALLSQIAIFPFFNIHITIGENLLIGLYFTLISIARSYILRRIFNKL